MSEEAILYIAYGAVFLVLIIIGVAMWKSGKDGDV